MDVYHATARVLGGPASSASSLDASFFSLGLVPIQVLGSAIGVLPLIGPLVSLPVLLATAAWQAHLVACHARARHGLDAIPAYVAASTPFALAVALVVGFWALAIGVLMSGWH